MDSSIWKTLVDITSNRRRHHRFQPDERQSSCFAGEEEKGEDWKGGGGLKSAINEKLPSL